MPRKKLNIGQADFGFPDEDIKTSLHDEIVLWVKTNARTIAEQLLNWKANWSEDLIAREKARLVKFVDERKEQLKVAITKTSQEVLNMETRMSGIYGLLQSSKQSLATNTEELNMLQSCQGLGDPPPPELNVTSELERPIQRQRYNTPDIVGYADIVIHARSTRLATAVPFQGVRGTSEPQVTAENYLKWSIDSQRLCSFAFDAKSAIPSLGELIRQFRTYQVYWTNMPFYVVSPDARFASAISDEGFGFIKYPAGDITLPKSRHS